MSSWIHWTRFPTIVAATTTRSDGVSSVPFDSLNLAYHTGDQRALVEHNRRLFLARAELNEDQLVLCHQSHADTVARVDKADGGKGAHSFESGVPLVDSLYTTDAQCALGILHADCVPVFFYAPSRHLVGIIHAGWQGTLKDVTFKVLSEVMTKENLSTDDVYIYLGPSITKDHLHVTDDMRRAGQHHASFNQYVVHHNGEDHYDVVGDNLNQLKKLGIAESHIDQSHLSTYANPELFFSWERAEGHRTGRHISFIYLK